MTPRGMWALCRGELAGMRGRALLSIAGIAAGVWVVTLVLALGGGIRQLVLREVVRELPWNMLEVVPRQLDLGLVQVDAGAWLGGGAKLDAQIRLRLSGLPDVEAVFGRMPLGLPTGARGGAHLLGKTLYTDVFVDAVDLPLLLAGQADGDGDDSSRHNVPAAAQPDAGVDHGEDCPGDVPVWISDQLVELFNSQVAPALGAPRLGARALVGLRFELLLGHQMMLGGASTRRQGSVPARIAGVSRWAMRVGLTTTPACARSLRSRFADGPGEPAYASLLVRASGSDKVVAVAQAIEGAGLELDKTAARTRRLMTAATGLSAAVGGMVLLMAAINIGHGFVAQLSERRRELAVLRALGASRRHMMCLLLGQAAVLGVVGGAVGLLATVATARGVDRAVALWLPHFPFRPPTFFVIDSPLVAGGLSLACLASILGALGPAWRAARRPIAQALAEG